MRLRSGIALAAVLLLAPADASAIETEVHGFVMPQLRTRVGDRSFSLLDVYEPFFRATAATTIDDSLSTYIALEGNLYYTQPFLDAIAVDLKEMYGEVFLDRVSIRAGRQIYTWGSVENMSPIDILNPQQLTDLDQSAPDRKLGVFAISAQIDLGLPMLDLVVIPFFRAAQVDPDGPFASAALQPRALENYSAAAESYYRGRYQSLPGQLAAAERALDTYDRQLSAWDATISTLGDLYDTAPSQSLLDQRLDAMERRDELRQGRAEAEHTYEQLYAEQQHLRQLAANQPGTFDYADNREPKPAWGNIQFGARLKFPLDFGDIAISGASMIQNVPGIFFAAPATVTGNPTLILNYYRTNMLGFDMGIPFGIYKVKADIGAFLPWEDMEGTRPWVPNPYVQAVLQFGLEPHQSTELRAGYMGNLILGIDSDAELRQERSIARLSGNPLLGLVDHSTMLVGSFKFGAAIHRVNLVWIYDFINNSHFAVPDFDFGFRGGLRFGFGSQLMFGKSGGFGALNSMDQIYAKIKYSF